METSSPKKLGGGKAHHAARCTLINSQVKTQLRFYKRIEPRLGLQHYLQVKHLNFCHKVLAGTLESVENQNHLVDYVKQQFHLWKYLQKKHSCCWTTLH
jgi:hypothetical protein